MKTKALLFSLLVIIFSGCSYPKYLPSYMSIDVNAFGSHIRVVSNSGKIISGELIAIDSSNIVVLSEKTNMCKALPVSEIKKYSLRYAKPKHYGWTIPVFTLASLTHGVISLITAPVNLATTIAITIAGENAYVYSSKEISLEVLKMFARYPQGLVADVDLTQIR